MFAIKTKEYIKNHPGTNLAIAMSVIINKDMHKDIYKAIGNVRTSINIKTPYVEFFVREVSDKAKKQVKIFIIRIFEDKIKYTNFKIDREDADYARTIFSKNFLFL